jgi:hypothetical protein
MLFHIDEWEEYLVDQGGESLRASVVYWLSVRDDNVKMNARRSDSVLRGSSLLKSLVLKKKMLRNEGDYFLLRMLFFPPSAPRPEIICNVVWWRVLPFL